ncbi:polysaccharide biosynthesis/export family protein [Qipengyuania sp. DGS5-3]|uniref:polysaccharide biosynthesis/export family protein n=1 Tax=Qipengyuania sp. DGS5-3 TaxID=3349632 RepID=UPI0036D43135
MRNLPLLLLSVLALSACSSAPPLRSTADLTVVNHLSGLPAPMRADLTAGDRVSLIGPLDSIAVEIFGVPELSGEMQVDTSGRIALPLIGTIDANGKTAAELSSDIENLLADGYVRDPNVTVNIKNSVSQVVTVDGQVVQPGLYPVTNQMTLMRAVASARGLTEFAKLDDVVVLRTVEGQRMAGVYNLTAIRRGTYADPQIYPSDLIVVGNSPQRQAFRDLIGLSPLLASPLVALVR